VCVCVYVYVYARVCVCICVCGRHVFVYPIALEQRYHMELENQFFAVFLAGGVYMCMCICVYVCVYVYMYVYMYVRMYVYVRVYVCIIWRKRTSSCVYHMENKFLCVSYECIICVYHMCVSYGGREPVLCRLACGQVSISMRECVCVCICVRVCVCVRVRVRMRI
jgi:hypothetical protein